jgi:hypothetical protein
MQEREPARKRLLLQSFLELSAHMVEIDAQKAAEVKTSGSCFMVTDSTSQFLQSLSLWMWSRGSPLSMILLSHKAPPCALAALWRVRISGWPSSMGSHLPVRCDTDLPKPLTLFSCGVERPSPASSTWPRSAVSPPAPPRFFSSSKGFSRALEAVWRIVAAGWWVSMGSNWPFAHHSLLYLDLAFVFMALRGFSKIE